MQYTYSGGDQTFTVPKGVTAVNAVVNGAGGGRASGGASTGGFGGSAAGTFSVTGGQQLTLTVGGVGAAGPSGPVYGRGGAGAPGNRGSGGAGGGLSAVWQGAAFTSQPFLVAGGGGGTGGAGAPNPSGGNGGGTTGLQGRSVSDNTGGRGASQTAGGAGGSGGTSLAGSAGTKYQGGTGGGTNGTDGGGGGGGGWYGGGGGGTQPTVGGNNNDGGGGGGSSYTDPSVTGAVTAVGGGSDRATNGTITLRWNAPAPTITGPADGSAVSGNPTVSGAAVPGNTVRLYNGTQLICTTTADENGAWSCGAATQIPDGVLNLTAQQTDDTSTTLQRYPTSTRSVVTVDNTAPNPVPDTAQAPYEKPVTVNVAANDADATSGIDAPSVVFPTDGQPIGATVSDGGRSLAVSGQGTYVVDPTTGEVTFTPIASYTGAVSAVTYSVADRAGNTATSTLTVTVGIAPSASADTATTDSGQPVDVTVLTNDTPGTNATFDTSSVRVVDAAGDPQLSTTVAGEGTWSATDTGQVRFVPVPGFAGTAQITYRATDSDGNAAESTVSVTVADPPTATADTDDTDQGVAVTTNVLANDDGSAAGLDPASVRIIVPDEGTLVTTLTVDGRGTYTANTDGTVTFVPDPTFSGDTPAVRYSVADANGVRATAALVITVAAAPDPSATADALATDYNTAATIDPTANDNPGTDSTSFVPGSVRVIDPADGSEVTDLTVEAEGRYVVDETTGTVTFTPAAAFAGETTPLAYTAATTYGGTVRSTITVAVGRPAAPTATDDAGAATFGKTITLTPLTNDDAGPDGTTFDAGTLRLVDPASGTDTGAVIIADEGTWIVDGTEILFVPDEGFFGTATRIAYRIDTNVGDTASAFLEAVIGAAPTAVDDSGTTRYNRATTVNVLANDSGGTDATIDPISLRLVDSNGNSLETLVVDGIGTWSLGADAGTVAFTPVSGFSGPASVTYRVADSNGDVAQATLTVTVGPPPTADDDRVATLQNTAVEFDPLANDDGGPAGLDVMSVRLLDPESGAQVAALTVADEGTYTVDTSTGRVTFTPVASFSGRATAVTYIVADTLGARTNADIIVTVTAGAAPTGMPDTPTGAFDTPVSVDPTANDEPGSPGATFVASSVRLLDPNTDAAVTPLVVDGEGTYTLDEGTGVVTFTPVRTFRGAATAVEYTASTTYGQDVRSTIRPTIAAPGTPAATDDTAAVPYGRSATIRPLDNDDTGQTGVTFDETSVRLVDPETGEAALTVDVADEGVWSLDGATSAVTFTPTDGFTGPTTPLAYQARTNAGDTVSATITVTSGAAPSATPNAVTVPAGRTATVDVLRDDTAGTGATLVPGSVRILDTAQAPVTTLTIEGRGIWSVDAATGAVSFAPVEGFAGTVAVAYTVTDSDGNTAAAAVTVTVAGPPQGVADTVSGPEGRDITLDPLANDTASETGAQLDPTTLRLIDPATGAQVRSVTISQQGTWTITADGTASFTPEAGFTGTAAAVKYTAADTDGVTLRSSLTAVITPIPPTAVDDTASGRAGEPITIDPLSNDDSTIGVLDPSSVRLVSPDGQLVSTLTVPGEGTYTVDTTTGTISFTSEKDFTGSATVTYSVANTEGNRATARVTFTVSADTEGTPIVTPKPGGGVIVTLPDGTQLAYTGSDIAAPAAAVASLFIVAGAVLLLRRRRGNLGL